MNWISATTVRGGSLGIANVFCPDKTEMIRSSLGISAFSSGELPLMLISFSTSHFHTFHGRVEGDLVWISLDRSRLFTTRHKCTSRERIGILPYFDGFSISRSGGGVFENGLHPPSGLIRSSFGIPTFSSASFDSCSSRSFRATSTPFRGCGESDLVRVALDRFGLFTARHKCILCERMGRLAYCCGSAIFPPVPLALLWLSHHLISNLQVRHETVSGRHGPSWYHTLFSSSNLSQTTAQ